MNQRLFVGLRFGARAGSLFLLLFSLVWAPDHASARSSAVQLVKQSRQLAAKLDQTAAYLAARYQYFVEGKQQQVEIDRKLKLRFLAILIAVHRSPLVPATAKSIIPRLQGLNRLLITFEGSCEAAVSRSLGRKRRTGVRAIDALLRKHKFKPTGVKPLWGMLPFVRAKGFVSCLALAQRLKKIRCVKAAGLDTLLGGGNEIDAISRGTGIIITLSRGWGDCPSGCTHRRTHSISVDERFKVKYLGAFSN